MCRLLQNLVPSALCSPDFYQPIIQSSSRGIKPRSFRTNPSLIPPCFFLRDGASRFVQRRALDELIAHRTHLDFPERASRNLSCSVLLEKSCFSLPVPPCASPLPIPSLVLRAYFRISPSVPVFPAPHNPIPLSLPRRFHIPRVFLSPSAIFFSFHSPANLSQCLPSCRVLRRLIHRR